MANLDDLSASQMNALGQLQAITNGADMDKELAILKSVGWDVQAAVQAIFDGQPVASSSTSSAAASSSRRTTPKELEPMELDDSTQSNPTPRRVYSGIQRPGLNLFSLFALPFTFSLNIFASFLHFVFRILRIPIPRFLGYISLARPPNGTPGGRPLLSGDPTDVAERFVRQLEEETGAMCISKAALVASEEGEAASAGASTSTSARHSSAGRLLPDFWMGSYESALRAAQREARVMCVVITSQEHDDTPEFRRTVLTDPELVRVLTDNQFIVWGGDIRDREGYQTALKLHATTYPFVSFISLHPSRTNGSSSSTSQLSVLSRHEGPPSSATSAAQLTQHITNSLLPRVTPHLNRIRSEHRARQQERELRQAQDRAFRDAERRDAERIMKRREEERRKVEEQERRRLEEEDKVNQERKKILWRRFARRTMLPKEAPMSSSASVRIGIRLPSGERAIRRFNPTDSLTALYVFVDSQFLPSDMTPETDPDQPPEGFSAEPTEGTWDFRLAVSFPRGQVDWSADKQIGEIPLLKGGANLVVELLRPIMDGSSSEEEEE